MPKRPAVPPPAALRGPVALSRADALGLSRHELSTDRWRRPFPGLRVHHSTDEFDPALRIRTILAWLPKWAVLGGWASLHWQGAAALDGRTGPGGRTLLPIRVHVGPRRHLRRRPGTVLDRSRLFAPDIVESSGIRVVGGTRAVFDEMCSGGVEEGLVVGDAALGAGLTSVAALTAYGRDHPGYRGIPAARVASSLLDGGARSGPESRFRYVWVIEAGLPKPLVNRGIVDDTGWLMGIGDLLDVEAATVGEYDGSQHRGLSQHTADNVREEVFESLNLTVVRATSVDLWPDRPRLVARL